MTAADKAYDRLHGVDGLSQDETPCCVTCQAEGWECSASCGRPCCVSDAATDWIVNHTLDRAEAAEAEVERLRAVLAEVRRAFDLQCPPMSTDKYVDCGAWMAHSWWNTVLGNILSRADQNSTEDK